MPKKLLLVIILLLALFFRGFQITKTPPSLNWDEASIGYNAYSILKTGRDEWGMTFPLHFKSFGEYKLPVQIYASIPAIALFGLNPFGVRVTPLFYGVLSVFILYLLVKELFKNEKIALVSSFLLAISPWHIQLTRASFESSLSLFLVLAANYFFIKAINTNKIKALLFSVVFFALSVYTYNSARVFSPLFLFCITVYYFFVKQLSFKKVLVVFGFFALLLLPLIPFVLNGDATARYKLVSVTNEAGLIPRINENRGKSQLPKPLPKLIHNKVTYISYYLAKNYLAHFTPNFLFIKGATHRQHHVQGLGELYYFQFIFLLTGCYILYKQKNNASIFLFLWLILSFIPVATTRDSIPNALRTVIANPVFQIATSVGFVATVSRFNNKKIKNIFFVAIGALILIEVGRFSDLLFNKYSIAYSRDWQYGNKEVVEYIAKNYDKYDMIVFTRAYGEPHIFTLFYLKYNPEHYFNNSNLERFQSNDWVWVTRFDKFYFPNLSDKGTGFWDIVNSNKGKKILFIGKNGDFPENTNRIYSINFLSGDHAFDLVEII